jgi:hypothetical protein
MVMITVSVVPIHLLANTDIIHITYSSLKWQDRKYSWLHKCKTNIESRYLIYLHLHQPVSFIVSYTLFFPAIVVRLVFTPVVMHPTSIHKDLEVVGTISRIHFNTLGSILWVM